MMTHDEIIAVVQAHKEGKQIQYLADGLQNIWVNTPVHGWKFDLYDYRVKPEPRMFRIQVNHSGDVIGWELKITNPGPAEGFLLVKEVM